MCARGTHTVPQGPLPGNGKDHVTLLTSPLHWSELSCTAVDLSTCPREDRNTTQETHAQVSICLIPTPLGPEVTPHSGQGSLLGLSACGP